MSISPLRPVGYAPTPGAVPAPPAPPSLPQAPGMAVDTSRWAPAPSAAPAGQAPGITAVAKAAMSGQTLPGASPLQEKVLGFVRKGQAAMNGLADKIFPATKAPAPGIAAATPRTLGEKLQQVGRSALFFALPVGGAALIAFGLGSFVGPWVPIIGSKALGAAVATLAVGHTAGSLLHGAMRLPLVTKPEDRETNSAGAALASGLLGMGFAAGVAGLAGATIGAPILIAGALIGAGPRIAEWALGRL